MKSIIFFDIDGTLVTEDELQEIPESTRTAIRLTREKGNLTFINTGRTEFNVPAAVRELGFDGILCGCGTYIEYHGEVLLYRTLEQDYCRNIAELMRRTGVTPVYERRDALFFDDRAVQNPEVEYFRSSFLSQNIPTDRQTDDPDFSFDKFVIWDNPRADMELFRREIGRDFDIIDRGHGFYENVPRGFSKATAIDTVLGMLGIAPENAYAIGDSNNDLPMLQAVPNSIAMGGAESLYPYVSYITTPIREDGIYNALSHFGLI